MKSNRYAAAVEMVRVTVFLAVAIPAGIASAQTTFQAFLTGLGENPPNASPGSGLGTAVLNAAQNQITVDLSWSGLTAPATAAHIHGPAGAGTNASVLFPFSGVPAATAGSIPEQTFAITPTQVGYLFAGYLYMNVHTATFPGGEIRGQLLLVGPPTSFSLTVTTNGSGAITANPAGGSYSSNTVVTLTATPNANYAFNGWSGDATGTNNPISVTMTNNKAITGNFAFVTNGVASSINLAAQICWFAATNRRYQVQAASVVNSNVWFDLGSQIQGNGDTNCYFDPFGGYGQRFYRVMTRP